MARMTPEEVASMVEVIGRELAEHRREFAKYQTDLLTAIQIFSKRLEDATARADRMADRLIEMAMVNRGAFREALAGRRTAALDPAKPFAQHTDDWGQPTEEKWPPEGYVEMQMP